MAASKSYVVLVQYECWECVVLCTQLRHTALADGGMTRVHPLGGAAIFKSCAPSVIFWALGIILRTGFLSLSSESCDLRPTWQRWRLLKTSNISLWIIFIRASIIIFQRLVLYIIANRSFITSACVSKFFLLLCEIVGEKQSEQIFVSKTNYSVCPWIIIWPKSS